MNYTISPIIYKLFLRLTPQQRADFIRDLMKIKEETL
jgi:hypothetical protein